MASELRREIEEFLYFEAELLDHGIGEHVARRAFKLDDPNIFAPVYPAEQWVQPQA